MAAAKIMLVEDDINLGEIYQARLAAEGFVIVSAKDGEEALALAVKEHPDLIISDVMMPKISGFDMLDILRGTEGIKNTKVIMMTALGQAEDKTRAEKLGADLYLVKSQVTLEDVVKSVHDILKDTPVAATGEPIAPLPSNLGPIPTPAVAPPATIPSPQPPTPPMPVSTQIPVTSPAPDPVDTTQVQAPSPATPPAMPPPIPSPPAQPSGLDPTLTQSASEEESNMQSQIQDIIGNPPSEQPTTPLAVPPPTATAPPMPSSSDRDNDHVEISKKLILAPSSDGPLSRPDIHTLLAAEEQKDTTNGNPPPIPPSNSLGAPNNTIDPNSIAL